LKLCVRMDMRLGEDVDIPSRTPGQS
jgi:hypothetical protein